MLFLAAVADNGRLDWRSAGAHDLRIQNKERTHDAQHEPLVYRIRHSWLVAASTIATS